MPILEHISCDALASEPLVWVRRIALFESLDPLIEIRSVKLGTGINVVWGIETEDADQHFEPGHGVGKTTFCRLIRYCLGESSFGQAHAVAEIRHTCPEGYVAAEIRVGGQSWAVLRPFAHHHASYAKPEATIEEQIADKPTRQSFTDFRIHLSATCLRDLRTQSVLSGGASILWDHLLAMCSRDQEARYQNLWNWRSARSDSGTPSFKQPKVDALLCLRAALQLLPDEETRLQTKLERIINDGTRIDGDIAERRREPAYLVRQLRRTLQKDFGIEGALDHNMPLDPNDLYGLPQTVQRRIAKVEKERDAADADLKALERQIAYAAASLQEPAELAEQEFITASITDEGTAALVPDVAKTIRELKKIQQDIRDARFSNCKYGQIMIGDCSYAQAQLALPVEQLEVASAPSTADVREAAARDQATAELTARASRHNQLVQRLREQLDALNARRDELTDARRNAKDDIKNLRTTLEQLVYWEAVHSGRVADSELARLIADRTSLVTRETTAKASLATLLSSQNDRATGIRRIYEALVKATLSPDFVGRIRLSSDGLDFRVFRGESLSGEAFDTLSILLADLAVLLMGALGQAKHPGLLIHDSPREADLGAAIYRRLLTSVSNLSSELRSNGEVPFQYIVTTTTEPPEALQVPYITRLHLGGDYGLLFRRQLHGAPRESQGELPLVDAGDQ